MLLVFFLLDLWAPGSLLKKITQSGVFGYSRHVGEQYGSLEIPVIFFFFWGISKDTQSVLTKTRRVSV